MTALSLSIPSRLIPAHAGKTETARARSAAAPAHPRSRGENQVHAIRTQITAGSSPLTRGKQTARTEGQTQTGLIPAHAGKTSLTRSVSSTGSAHPRSRGENRRLRSGQSRELGSSPLTRGKPSEASGVHIVQRLIPAHAGKTARGSQARRPCWAHPRSRGENGISTVLQVVHAGSSPLTRGKLSHVDLEGIVFGLIPAHTGKTNKVTTIIFPPAAHPRSRGENLAVSPTPRPSRGSSPLTRGKRSFGGPHRWPRRLIPAHAGKTVMRAGFPRGRRAHPRSRGENPAQALAAGGRQGSSPLTRGKLLACAVGVLRRGLIPAHAGKTSGRGPPRPGGAAHPRSRGENGASTRADPPGVGSSPLTRGKLSLVYRGICIVGLIPAHAGKKTLVSPPGHWR